MYDEKVLRANKRKAQQEEKVVEKYDGCRVPGLEWKRKEERREKLDGEKQAQLKYEMVPREEVFKNEIKQIG